MPLSFSLRWTITLAAAGFIACILWLGALHAGRLEGAALEPVRARAGIAYQKAAMPALLRMELLLHTHMFARNTDKLVEAVDLAFGEIGKVQGQYGDMLGFTSARLAALGRSDADPAQMARRWSELKARVAMPFDEATKQAYETLIHSLIDLMDQAGEGGRLTFESDLDIRYLADAAQALPRHIDRLGLLAARAARMNRVMPADQIDFAAAGRLMQEAEYDAILAHIEAGLKHDPYINGASPSLKPALAPKINAYRDMFGKANAGIALIVTNGEAMGAPMLANDLLRTQVEAYALWEALATEIDTMLSLKQELLKGDAFQTRLVLGLSLAAAMVLFLAVLHSVAYPLERLRHQMEEVADERALVQLDGTGLGGETGAMARALDKIRQLIAQKSDALLAQEAAYERAMADRKRLFADLATGFDLTVKQSVELVLDASRALDMSAQAMEQAAGKADGQMEGLSYAIGEAVPSVREVRESAERLTQHMQALLRHNEHALFVASDSSEQGERTRESLRVLERFARQSDQIAEQLAQNATQTSLLALNAAIEAARAGDAGRTYANLAGEVKAIAEENTKTLGAMGEEFAAARAAITEATGLVHRLLRALEEMKNGAGSLKESLDAQEGAGQTLMRSATLANEAQANLSSSGRHVAESLGENRTAAGQVRAASAELARQAERLRVQANTFLIRVRAA